MLIDCCWALWPQVAGEVLRGLRDVLASGEPAARIRGSENDPPPRRYANHGGVAVIPVNGPQVKRWPGWIKEATGWTDYDGGRLALQEALADEDVHSLMLLLDTPGGSVVGLSDYGDALFAARGRKPIVAQSNGLTASAGYYLAAQADRFYAGRTDMVGSIGTVSYVYDYSEAFAKEGVRPVVVTSAPKDRPFKGAGIPGTAITDQHEDDMQRIVDAYFADFRAVVQRGRGLSNDQFDAVADGRVWVGDEARALRLVDGVQSPSETVRGLAATAAALGETITARAARERLELAARGRSAARARLTIRPEA